MFLFFYCEVPSSGGQQFDAGKSRRFRFWNFAKSKQQHLQL
jgi:hypothetical protein